MKRLEMKALNAAISFVNNLSDRGLFLEMKYHPLAGMEISCKRYSDDSYNPPILEGKIDISEEESLAVRGINKDFVNYIKEKLK